MENIQYRLINYDLLRQTRQFIEIEPHWINGIRRRRCVWEILNRHGYIVSQNTLNLIDNHFPPYEVIAKKRSIDYHLRELYGTTKEFLAMIDVSYKTYRNAVDKLECNLDTLPFTSGEARFIENIQLLAGFYYWELGLTERTLQLEKAW